MPKFYPGDAVEIIGQDVKVPNLLTDGNVDGRDVSADGTTLDAIVSDTVYGAGWNGVTTIAPSKNAVYDKIETLGAGATLTVAETSAFGAADAPTSYTDLDLSGVVGSNFALVLLKVQSNTSATRYAFRQNGEAYSTQYGSIMGTGGDTFWGNTYSHVWVVTDATGKVEWICATASENTQVWIMAYIK